MKTKTILFLIILLTFSSPAFAKSGDTIVSFGFSNGSGDVKLAGTSYSVDTEQTGVAFSSNVDGFIITGSTASGEATLAGITIDVDQTALGIGFVDGDFDVILGTGQQRAFGFKVIDYEVSLGSVSSSDTTYEIGFGSSFGIGNGSSIGFSFDTDTDDIFSDNSYSGSITKSFGSAIFTLGANYNIYVTDANNSGDSTVFFLNMGYVF